MAKMSNFEVTFELQGLKIHVKGDREIAPSIANNVGRQFASVLSPAGLIEAPKNGHDTGVKVIEAPVPPSRSKRKRGGRPVSAEVASPTPVTWAHDVDRWGSPVQGWKTLQKSAWLLFVVEQAVGKKDLSSTEIADIYQASFRDAGPPRPSNVARDLAKESSLFGDEDGRFYLKQAGKDAAAKLVEEAKGSVVAA
jgi:hypothetical protein